jgi:hypothetical protein
VIVASIHDVAMQPVGTGSFSAFGSHAEAGRAAGEQRWAIIVSTVSDVRTPA